MERIIDQIVSKSIKNFNSATITTKYNKFDIKKNDDIRKNNGILIIEKSKKTSTGTRIVQGGPNKKQFLQENEQSFILINDVVDISIKTVTSWEEDTDGIY